MPRRDALAAAWIAFGSLSSCTAAVMAALASCMAAVVAPLGIASLPLGLRERGTLAMAALLLVHASVSPTRTLRDCHAADLVGTLAAEAGR